MANTPLHADSTSLEAGRRSTLKRLAGGLWALLFSIPAGLGAVFALDPVLRKRSGGDDRRVRVTNVDALPDDGTPADFPVLADKVDAWNRLTNTEIGRVWLRKMPNDQVLAWTAICPHVGGLIDYKPAEEHFVCPLHHSVFDLDGERVNDVSPRPMDSLDAEIVDGDVFVTFADFKLNVSDKEVVG